MREIMFRGYDGMGWIYGSAVIYDRNTDTWYMIENGSPDDDWIMVGEIGQYTSLKDKNGVEIYEGDIVKYSFKDKDQVNSKYMEIIYRFSGFVKKEIYRDYWLQKENGLLNLKHGTLTSYAGSCETLYPSNEMYFLEIIGNIHENPDLLEVSS